MFSKLFQVWKTPDLRKNVIFVLAMLVVFRLAAHIPIPGVDPENLRQFFASNQILGLLNVFSGGTMESFSVVALGVSPYITASIIFQLLAMIIPRLEEMQKEGQAGQERINQYTRMATVPLAFLQAYGMIALLRQAPRPVLGDLDAFGIATILTIMTAGTVFLMWIGELISEKKIGNGISLLIFAGIIAGLPSTVQQALVSFDPSQVLTWAAFAAIALVTIAGVVVISEGQRNVPVIYAKRMRGTRLSGGAETFLPLRVNMAGVIPIIFAISIILFPPMIAQFFIQAKTEAVARFAQATIAFFQDQTIYGILYFLMVMGFTYFYTAVIFHPEQVAENLQKQGGFIPGIRPGRPTAEHLMRTLNRITPAAAIFLAVIAVLPLVAQNVTGSQTLAIGGTSLLIVVSVVIETVNQ
ncbi:preprotein translocase subunit SecY, partial [Candidatus Uhrbacteria bacterium]|nr:preprotein translocase subunit SecY [Candidatus Uhrbacteria bacterium]